MFYIAMLLVYTYCMQGRIQARKILGYFVWKINNNVTTFYFND
jgi:hypothetical protein